MSNSRKSKIMDKCTDLIKKYYLDKGVLLKSRALDEEIISSINQNSRVLDAGCGYDAAVISKYYSLVNEAVGVDLINEFQVNPSIKTFTANLEDLPFENNYFNLIISKDVFEHLENPLNVLKEFKRVLKRGGKIIILTPNKYSYFSIISNLLPTSFKAFYLKKVFGKIAYDNFPTFYRCNSKNAIKKIAKLTDLTLEKFLALRHYPYYFMFSVILFRLGILFDMLISVLKLNFLKTSLLFVLKKN